MKLIKIAFLTTVMMSSGLWGMKQASLNAELRSEASYGYLEQIERLITKGADVNARNPQGDTPLILATQRGNYQICEALIANGADVNVQDKNGGNALMIAAHDGLEEICKLFITKGANINAREQYGRTALMLAATMNFEEICKILIDGMMKLTPQERSQISTLLGLKKRNIPGLHPDTKKLIALEKLADIKREKKQNAREQIMKITNEELKNKLLKYLESIK